MPTNFQVTEASAAEARGTLVLPVRSDRYSEMTAGGGQRSPAGFFT